MQQSVGYVARAKYICCYTLTSSVMSELDKFYALIWFKSQQIPSYLGNYWSTIISTVYDYFLEGVQKMRSQQTSKYLNAVLRFSILSHTAEENTEESSDFVNLYSCLRKVRGITVHD